MSEQLRLVETPPELSLKLQEDALELLEDVVVFCLTEDWEWIDDEQKSKRLRDVLDQAIDILSRGGRL